MSTAGRVLALEPHLRALHALLYYPGVIAISFNSSSERFVEGAVIWRQIFSKVILNILKYVYQAFFIMALAYYTVAFLDVNRKVTNEKSIDIQENILLNCSGYFVDFCAYLFACNYLKYHSWILPTLNELVDIFKEIRRRSDSRLFFAYKVGVMLFLKAFVMLARINTELWATIAAMYLYLNFIGPYCQLIASLMFFTHAYAQMVLICFYSKMSGILERLSEEGAAESEITDTLRDLLELSFRIARVKRQLDTLHTAIFVSTYLGLFRDIYLLYEFMKIIVYAKYLAMNPVTYYRRLRLYFPLCFASSFDMYLIGYLSDLLMQAEAEFQRNLMAFVNSGRIRRSLELEVELTLHQNLLFGLETLAYGAVMIDQQFSFGFVLNSIVVYVIMFLQFYASETIYSQDNHAGN